MFEIVGWTDDGRTPEHGYTISSPMSLWLRLAKKEIFSDHFCTQYWLASNYTVNNATCAMINLV